MPYLYIKKENGKITEKITISGLSRETIEDARMPYFTDEENCFVKQLHVNPRALAAMFEDFYYHRYALNLNPLDHSEIQNRAYVFLEIQRDISEMIDKVLSSSNASVTFQNLFNDIKEAKTKKDLCTVLSGLCHAYRDALKELVQEGKISRNCANYRGVGIYNWFKKDSNAVLTVILKTITNVYFRTRLQTMSMNELEALKEARDAGISYDQLLENMGENFSDTAKANGVNRLAAKSLQYNLSNVYLNRIQNRAINSFGGADKCLSCLNCENRDCKLLYYWDRLPIESFDYVKDAILVISPDHDPIYDYNSDTLNYDNSLMVFDCSKYQYNANKDPERFYTNSQKKLKR